MIEMNAGKENSSEDPTIAETNDSKLLQGRNHDEKKPQERKQNQMVAEKTNDMYFGGLMSE